MTEKDVFDNHLDNSPDPFVDKLREREQIESSLENIAHLTAFYYHELIKSGMPQYLADSLTVGYNILIMQSHR